MAQERTLGQLVADASQDLQSIVKGEIALAKMEIKSDVSKGGKGAGLLVGAGIFGLFTLGFLLTAGAWGLFAAGLPRWAAFLIVGGVLLLITLILALMGKSALSKMQGKPVKTIDNAEKTIAALKPPKAS
ncbi:MULTISPECIES: phage holin family protein [Yimella]|uniref:Putative superfamily III holin-X n=1 Tax=Yimella lutea TaxID=587872 RepID=A0A542EDK6_9MICO|nr:MULTISPECIES: phage holin family protein [Yimella]MCG8656405.1 phage holin family protein [Yimella sp. NH-Cas1]RYG78409.1 phage holin family protein [Yimella sp. RIT 621]TQJ13356.1 putative superfamily III holin-X [Yimella lutea]